MLWLIATKDEGKLTIEQVFDYTPDPNYVITACIYRPDDWLLLNGDFKRCNERFIVKKFFVQEFICYDFQERVPKATFMESATQSTFAKNSTFTPSISMNRCRTRTSCLPSSFVVTVQPLPVIMHPF